MGYQKPMALMNDDLAEGVYTASGLGEFVEPGSSSSSETSSQKPYTLTLTNAWDGNKQYDITFTNSSSEKVDSVSVTLKVIGTVTSIGGNVSGTINGNTAVVTFNNYGNGIEGDATVGPIYMAITGTGEFGLE